MTVDAEARVTVRYFAAARAAAGTESELLHVGPAGTVAHLVDLLKARDAGLARVLARCSYLLDGVAVRDMDSELRHGQTVDVLPPFAGG
ncbi:MoaD/ThiS family protein [Mycobacterium sp. 4D054]|uniref:MoaD/ThiS family protein n=1 Tax=unclassified Mycobacterium TaxID=2642494 RepID=UPI0021B4CFDD|nr:MoaD/ThiS family protein [Mycobacterium sp. SMC-8]UXA12748.1 MoaD/ThiS family protein [Mycobacterium sp. SMC-8]